MQIYIKDLGLLIGPLFFSYDYYICLFPKRIA